MKYELGSITFSSWQFMIPIAIAVVGVVICSVWGYYKKTKDITKLSHVRWRRVLFPGFSTFKQIAKAACLVMSFAFVGIAVLRPQWGQTEEVVKREGRDLFIVLDVSRSMLAQDIKPNRLNAAKDKIGQLIQRLDSERVGLLLFSGSAFVQCPLTIDRDALYMFLNVLDAETISSGTTALEQALIKAQAAFKDQDMATKLVIIVTDGEDFSSNLSAVTRAAHDDGLTICALGMATEHGAPIPIINQEGVLTGYEMDEDGTVVLSRLNEAVLSSVAADGGGMYVRATTDDADVSRIVGYVDRFEKREFEDRMVINLQERYYYPLALALVLFLCAWIV